MQLIKGEKYLTDNLSLDFDMGAAGWWAVAITARTRSEKQRGRKATDDEDLKIELDGQGFPKLDNSRRYFDSPAAFSGAAQKNTAKTVYLIAYLAIGKHNITLIPDEGATLENIELSPLAEFPRVKFSIGASLEKRDRSPWVTFVLVNVGLNSFSLDYITNWRFSDGDDLKIIVDGKVKKNRRSILHRNWVLAASILRKISGQISGKKEFTEKLLPDSIHYLEIWADGSPTIKEIAFNLASSIDDGKQGQKVKPYSPGPNGEDYNRYDEEIKKETEAWNEKFLNQEYPPSEPLDPNLVKAMIYVESRLGYGSSPTGHPAYPDVMQVADPRNPAIHTMNNDGWVDPTTQKVAKEYEWMEGQIGILDYNGQANGDSVEASVHWGVRWLYHKAQGILSEGGRYWRSWEQAVADYNKKDNWDYQGKVYKIYKEGLDSAGRKLKTSLIFLILSIILVTVSLAYQYRNPVFYAYATPSEDERGEYDFQLAVWDGWRLQTMSLVRNKVNWPADIFYDEEIFTDLYTPSERKERLIAVLGKNLIDEQAAMVIAYRNGYLDLLPKLDEYGLLEKAFTGDYVMMENLDDDPEDEIVEKNFLYYQDADGQIWASYYDFDREMGVYRFVTKTKTSYPSLAEI